MCKEEDVREALNRAAQAMAQVPGNPRPWLSWIIYRLTRLEDQAAKASATNPKTSVEMLAALQDVIRNRARTGGRN
jgi:hypothetical protein